MYIIKVVIILSSSQVARKNQGNNARVCTPQMMKFLFRDILTDLTFVLSDRTTSTVATSIRNYTKSKSQKIKNVQQKQDFKLEM